MTLTSVIGHIVATVLIVAGVVSMWLDCKARERRAQERAQQAKDQPHQPPQPQPFFGEK